MEMILQNCPQKNLHNVFVKISKETVPPLTHTHTHTFAGIASTPKPLTPLEKVVWA
jgi:hypothetical protein